MIAFISLIICFQLHAGFFDWIMGRDKTPPSSSLSYPNLSPSDYGHRWKNEWTKRVYDQLDNPELSYFLYSPMILNVDAQKTIGCPNYLKLSVKERKMFWAIFIASMSNREGRHKDPAYINPTDHKRRNVGVSAGLLQIDSLNAEGAGCRKDDGSKLSYRASKGKISSPKDEISMKDPLLNIKCGMYILQKELMSRGGRLMSSGSYWSILRPSGQDDEAFVRLLKKDLNQITSCQVTALQNTTQKTKQTKINQGREKKDFIESNSSPSSNNRSKQK